MIEFVALFLVFYVWHAMGITIGYHRLLSHRSFFCSKAVEYFWVLPGYLSFEGSPIWWSTMHRAHHRHVDTPLDPHSPRYGVMHALTGWLEAKEYLPHIDPKLQAKDLLKDPIYRFLECNGNLMAGHAMMFVINIAFRVALFAMFGWVVALASLLAGASVLGIPLLLNVVCHMTDLGYKNYDTTDDSVNVWWVALLAQGEGWHNNHHACPGSARSGMRPSEIDTSWWMISAMRKLGLVYNVNEAKHYNLMRRSAVVRVMRRKKIKQRLQNELLQVSG
ncbi:MAG: acyl-CoA desaturase [Cyanobacteria bacterium REEB67]|nr:acyl-CoA desaturase [Cyanobacteria bacterium REEB67]